ncbi:MAG: hypothetical protein QM736_08920 [Vicinamibacterales bacterium]
MRIGIEARVARKSHTPLDATFVAWANPPDGSATGGDYPFAFDCPDGGVHAELPLPLVVDAQIAAFAQQVRGTNRRPTTGPPKPRRVSPSIRARSFHRG